MKSIKSLFPLICFALAIGCSSDDDTNNNTNNDQNGNNDYTPALTAKVNGDDFIATRVRINFIVSHGGRRKIGCEAEDADGNNMTFAIQADTVGRFEATGGASNPETSSLDFTYTPAGQVGSAGFASMNNQAVVTFTEVYDYDGNDMRISGTFEFDVSSANAGSFDITDGVFQDVTWDW